MTDGIIGTRTHYSCDGRRGGDCLTVTTSPRTALRSPRRSKKIGLWIVWRFWLRSLSVPVETESATVLGVEGLMWCSLRKSQQTEKGLISATREVFESTSRNVIAVTGGAAVLWYYAYLLAWPTKKENAATLFLVTLVIALTCLAALRMLSRRFLVAQFVWQGGLVGAITLAAHLLRRPELGFLYALLPMTAVVAAGWSAGLLVEGLVVILMISPVLGAATHSLSVGTRMAIADGQFDPGKYANSSPRSA